MVHNKNLVLDPIALLGAVFILALAHFFLVWFSNFTKLKKIAIIFSNKTATEVYIENINRKLEKAGVARLPDPGKDEDDEKEREKKKEKWRKTYVYPVIGILFIVVVVGVTYYFASGIPNADLRDSKTMGEALRTTKQVIGDPGVTSEALQGKVQSSLETGINSYKNFCLRHRIYPPTEAELEGGSPERLCYDLLKWFNNSVKSTAQAMDELEKANPKVREAFKNIHDVVAGVISENPPPTNTDISSNDS